jgi:NADH-quinone oxidoreductase subunit N
VKTAGIGVLVRLLAGPFAGGAAAWGGLLWGVAALTMIVGNLGALAQKSVKRMLAYSSIAHTGYALVGLVASQKDPMLGASSLFYVFVYTFMTLGAFAFVAWAGRPPSPAKPHGQDAEDIAEFAGLARTRPWAAAFMTLLMVSLAGIPPTGGFWGKFLIFQAAIARGDWGPWLAAIMVVNSVISIAYYFAVPRAMIFAEAGSEELIRPSWLVTAVVATATVALVVIFVVPNPLAHLGDLSVLSG